MRWRTFQVVAVLASMLLVAFTSVTARRWFDSMSVTPDNQASGTLSTNMGYSASFTVTLNGDEMDPQDTVRVWCVDQGALDGACSLDTTIVMTVNSPEDFDVPFTTGTATGSGTLWLNASGQISGLFDSGSRTYTVNAPVTVTSLSVPSSVVQHSEDNTATFTVDGGSGGTFDITCAWGGAGGCLLSDSTVVLGSGEDTVVTVTFDAGAVTTSHTLELTAADGPNADSASESVTVSEYGAVNVVAQLAKVYAEPDVQRTDTFYVRFPGQSATSFDMSVDCPGGATEARSCSVEAADQSISVGDTPVKVRVNYTAGASGDTSVVQLTATQDGGASVTHSGAMSVIASSGVLLSVEDANFGLEIDRGDCLNIAAGPGAIVCDDYQFVYPFTPVMRMNKSRQLALIYNNSVAHHMGRYGVNIVLPESDPEPDSIQVETIVAGTSLGSVTYPAWHYERGVPFRVAKSWTFGVNSFEQLVPYTFVVRTYDLGSLQSTDSISGKEISLDKRRWFGRGWWLAGYEHLRPRTDPDLGDVLIWTGGDLSARVYVEEATDTFVARSRTRADTIIDVGTEYVRHLVGGGHVVYNSSGYHTHTISRNADTTFFNHEAPGRWTVPTSIEVTTPSGRDTIYKLAYSASDSTLEKVHVRSGAGGWEAFELYTTKDGDQFQYDSIVAPDGQAFGFAWDNGPGEYRLDTIFDPRGAETAIDWSWDAVRKVTTTADTFSVVVDYLAASPVGLSPFGSNDYRPRPTNDWRAKVDGPLPGDADTTGFFFTGWRAVRGIRDALGNSTWIDREDSLEALPTRVRHPNGWEVTASYTSFGLPDSIVDRSNGAVTTYQWNTEFSVPTQITSPEGVVTTFSYDGNGNLETRTVGNDKDSLRYNSDFLVDAVVDPMGRTWTFDYDDRGNLEWEETPDSTRTLHFADYLGRDTLTVSPINDAGDSVRVRQGYDVVGRPIFTTTRNDLDAKWDSTTTTYDSITGDRIKVENVGGVTASPNYSIGPSEWEHDGLGRVTVSKPTPLTADTIFYDLAGNDTLRLNSNGDTIRMTYDLLGRLKTRYTSEKFFADTTTLEWSWRFPIYDTLGLTIDTMTATFNYDSLGNLVSANNAFSRITRTYALNGALRTEEQALRRYDDPQDFTTHVYELEHFYDLDGRRVGLLHPSWLSPGTGQTDYAYDATSGRLSSVTDALGNAYEFEYNADGQPKVVWLPGGVDSLFYDEQGRLESQRTRADGISGAEAWSVTRDVAGRVLSEAGVTPATYEYDGLGHLKKSEVETEPQLFVDQYFTRDPHGNAIVEQDFEDPFEFGEEDPPGTKWDHDHHGSKGGRRAESEEVWDYKGLAEPDGWNPGHAVYTYDGAGNATDVYDSRYTHTYSGIETGWDDAEIDVHYRSYSKSYYDAEGRLRVHQINRDSLHYEELQVDSGPPWGAYEEYWYDALGRRVLKRSRQEAPICTGWDTSEQRCYSSIERYVWDGDQILWELRQANDGDTKDPTGLPLSGQTGHIGYVYAGGIDMPRGMIRNGTTIVLHRNWKGQTTFVTDTAGAPTTCAPDTYVSESCTPIVSFPGASWALTQGYEGALDVQVWYGSVTMGHQDRSGLRYQRNRYHDPSAGQFTQLDPIGIAGGLNLYGYAGGDPVNFSDPFGLDPCEESDAWTECIAQKIANWGAKRGGAAGRIALEASAMLNWGMEATGINAVASFGDAIGTALETGEGLTVTAALAGSLEIASGGKGKPTLTATKAALRQVHGIVGHLPGSARGMGRFGSPMRGDAVRGYRLDPPHPNALPGSPEAGYHINYWDWTMGKRGSGGIWGAIPIGGR